jgi:hypothetical protein
MTKLGYSEKEVFIMTPRKFFLMYDQYLEMHGLKEKEVSIDAIL